MVNFLICASTSAQTPAAPFAMTGLVTGITGQSAVLSGAVTPNSSPAWTGFQWGTNTNYGFATPYVPGGSGTSVVWASVTISDLVASQPYHYRFVASNSLGVTYGADILFGAAKKISAWGYNASGQLNVPTTSSNSVQIAAGGSHSMGANVGGAVTAWGDDYYGQTSVPQNVTNAVTIAGGYNFSMALLGNGSVAVWGDNTYGETNAPALSNVVAIAAGDSHCLALLSSGFVVGWGLNDEGQATAPAGLSNVVAVAAGGSHSMALLNNGSVVAWGDNTYGESDVPAGLSNVVAISAGVDHSVALQSNGTVTAWGDNTYGQCNVPAKATNLVSISAGRLDTIALTGSGSVVAWGDNTYGETNIPPGMTNAIAVAAGGYHNLALTLGHLPIITNQYVVSVPISTVEEYSFIVLNLSGIDPDGDPLSFSVASLPTTGYLVLNYESESPTYVTSDNTPITSKPAYQFYQSPITLGMPYTTFQYTVSYGEYVSAPATVTINVINSPSVNTLSALSVTATNAALQGNVAANFAATGAWFQWGMTTNYGNSTITNSVGNGTNAQPINATITGLSQLTTYHYRAVASNSVGTIYGTDASFTTPLAPISIATAQILPSGAFHITFNASAGTTYSLWSSSNLVDWTIIGTSTEDLPGVYEANDPTATNVGARFYELSWP